MSDILLPFPNSNGLNSREFCYKELGKEGLKENRKNNGFVLYLRRGKRKVHTTKL